MRLPIYQLDAFTSRLFGGNPAAVVPMEEWPPDATLQAIAAENNLSETAYFVRRGDEWELRWFTPTVEMDLCGHATLASAAVIFRHVDPERRRVVFRTRKAGALVVSRSGEELSLELPAGPPKPLRGAPFEALEAALGRRPIEVHAGKRDWLCLFEATEEVHNLRPDFDAIARLDTFALICTAPGIGEFDFVSRFFAPGAGVPEDPVTGSAHCTLVPFWAERLGRKHLRAKQVSARGGELTCELSGDRVVLSGRVISYLEGWITI
jgi:PhzF family phenazine biosynthesis protein